MTAVSLAHLTAVPDADDDNFVGFGTISVPHDVIGLTKWHDQFARVGRADPSAAFREVIK